MTILIVDNYDSFTHNLYQMIGALGAEVEVHRNDALTLEDIRRKAPSHIVLSPGPGHPANPRDFGVCTAIIEELGASVPTLGVCLGHQGIAQVLGGRVVRAPSIVHGKTSAIRHNNKGLFAGLDQDIEVMRYHSLIAERASLPKALRVTAETCEGALIMGIAHVEWPVVGVQFHPESIGTPSGSALMTNFLEM